MLKEERIAIRADKVSKSFSNGKIGLHECSFEIPSESLVAILGPSGCGKSTLLKVLCGDSIADKGEIRICGKLLNEENYEYLKTHIGYVPQDDIIHKELTVYQTLHYAAHLRLTDSNTKEILKKVDEVLATLGITELKNEKISSISGGQRKRVSIAVEILIDPLILFLDEPTSPLDPQTIEDFLLTLRALSRSKGTCVVMVTHKPEDLAFMDKAIFMAEGGHFVYFDSAERYLDYFNETDVVKVYSKLAGTDAGYWIKKYKQVQLDPTLNIASEHSLKRKGVFFYSRQYAWLTLRYLNIKINDPLNLLILLAQAPIIAILICSIFSSVSQVLPFFPCNISNMVWNK